MSLSGGSEDATTDAEAVVERKRLAWGIAAGMIGVLSWLCWIVMTMVGHVLT